MYLENGNKVLVKPREKIKQPYLWGDPDGLVPPGLALHAGLVLHRAQEHDAARHTELPGDLVARLHAGMPYRLGRQNEQERSHWHAWLVTRKELHRNSDMACLRPDNCRQLRWGARGCSRQRQRHQHQHAASLWKREATRALLLCWFELLCWSVQANLLLCAGSLAEEHHARACACRSLP